MSERLLASSARPSNEALARRSAPARGGGPSSKRPCIRGPLVLFALASSCGEGTLELGSRYLWAERIPAAEGGSFVIDEADAPGYGGVGIRIGPGSLDEDTVVFVEPAAALPAPEGIEWSGPAVRFGPVDLGVVAAVRLRVDPPPSDERLAVVGLGDGSIRSGVAVEGAAVVLRTATLGVFQPGQRATPARCRDSSDCSTEARCDPRRRACVPAELCRSDRDCPLRVTCDLRVNRCR